jgi:DNA-binding transcriptional ArsR family regulator
MMMLTRLSRFSRHLLDPCTKKNVAKLRRMSKYLRNIRKIRLIDALFLRTRRDILANTYGQLERWFYLSELAEQLNTTPSSLQRELKSLVAFGILRQRRGGRLTQARSLQRLSASARMGS